MSRATRVVSSIVGIILFVFALRVAGVHTVLEGIRRTGIGFLWVILLSGFRFVVRAFAWRLCVEDPERLSLRGAMRAFITGDAIGNLTLFGPIASEGSKAVVARADLSTMSALSSIALENIFYALSVAVMVMAGVLVFVSAFQMTPIGGIISLAIIAAAVLLGTVALLLLYRRPRVLTSVAEFIVARTSRFGLQSRVESIRELEDRIHRFASSHPERVPQVLFYEFLFHAAGVAEIYVLLLLLVGGPPRTLLLQSIVLETVNRLITVAFKFVPMRIGVDEAGSVLMAGFLALAPGLLVTMAIVRKARTLFWSAIGLGVLGLAKKESRV